MGVQRGPGKGPPGFSYVELSAAVTACASAARDFLTHRVHALDRLRRGLGAPFDFIQPNGTRESF